MKLVPDARMQAAMAALATARGAFEVAAEAGLVLGNDNHIGDIGEYWVRRYYETLGLFSSYASVKNAPYDIELIDGTRISVKTLTAWSKRGLGTQVKPLCGTHWQVLAAVLLDRDLQPAKIALVPLTDLNSKAPFVANLTNRTNRGTKTYPRFEWWPWLENYVSYPIPPEIAAGKNEVAVSGALA